MPPVDGKEPEGKGKGGGGQIEHIDVKPDIKDTRPPDGDLKNVIEEGEKKLDLKVDLPMRGPNKEGEPEAALDVEDSTLEVLNQERGAGHVELPAHPDGQATGDGRTLPDSALESCTKKCFDAIVDRVKDVAKKEIIKSGGKMVCCVLGKVWDFVKDTFKGDAIEPQEDLQAGFLAGDPEERGGGGKSTTEIHLFSEMQMVDKSMDILKTYPPEVWKALEEVDLTDILDTTKNLDDAGYWDSNKPDVREEFKMRPRVVQNQILTLVMARHLVEVMEGQPPYWRMPPQTGTPRVIDDNAVATLQATYKKETANAMYAKITELKSPGGVPYTRLEQHKLLESALKGLIPETVNPKRATS